MACCSASSNAVVENNNDKSMDWCNEMLDFARGRKFTTLYVHHVTLVAQNQSQEGTPQSYKRTRAWTAVAGNLSG